ncbi:MAG: hypothetical protein Q8L88_06395 [Bacteroidota bacterium]|nr:hypothetical protein [Bacteroidota bacterium]
MISKRSFQGQKRHDLTSLLIFLLLFPYIVGFTDSDSTYSALTIAVGKGQFAEFQKTGDCSGYFRPASYTEGNVRIETKGEYIRFGLTAAATSTSKNKFIVWPTLVLDFKYFAIGTDRLRLGTYDALYAELGLINSIPISSGKGALNLGIGVRCSEQIPNIWAGYSLGLAFAKPGFGTEITFQTTNTSQLIIGGRYGVFETRDNYGNDGRYSTAKIDEYGIGIGYRLFFH